MLYVFGCEIKTVYYVFWWFLIIDLSLAISMESFRRDLNGMAERRSILKTDQNTYYPRFSFTPDIGIELPKTGVLFLLC